MAGTSSIATSIFIKAGGSPLEDKVKNTVQEVVVDQSLQLPDMFTILISDQRNRDGNYLIVDDDRGQLNLGKEVEIEAKTEDGSKFKLIKGEITAVEPDFGSGMVASVLIRGYDKTHRMHRLKKTRTFLNQKDSDVANKIADDHGLSPQVEQTKSVYDYIVQNNQTDMEFLQQRAQRIGFEAFAQEDKLFFRKPTAPSSPEITLKMGEDLQSFQPRLTLSYQVDEVIVKGWDVEKKESLVGQATKGKLFPQIGESKNGAQLASTFGKGKVMIVDQPVVSQEEANALAQGLLDEVSRDSVQAEGQAADRPDMKAGQVIKIEGVGRRFSGNYYLTSVTHTWTSGGLEQQFSISGRIPNGSAGLLSGDLRQPVDRWPGVVVAVVTDTDDPKDWGRVKVKYPWLADDVDSDWARVVSVGAGGEGSGFFAVPEVNDEVLVAFEHGDMHRPYVIGGLWNGQDAVPGGGAGAKKGEKPKVRTWTSRTGHYITIHDDADDKIEIKTKDGQTITMDNKNKTIDIISQGDINIEAKGQINMKATKDIAVQTKANMTQTSTGEMKLEATKNMNLETKMVGSIKALQLSLEAKTKAELKGLTVSVNGSTLTEVKGALVKIN